MLGGMGCNDSFQYIPLLPGLRGLICNDNIFDEVNNIPKNVCRLNLDLRGKLIFKLCVHPNFVGYSCDDLYYDNIRLFVLTRGWTVSCLTTVMVNSIVHISCIWLMRMLSN